MIPIKSESNWRGTANCGTCGMRDIALFSELNEQDFALIHAPIDDMAYQPGQTLYQESETATGVFTLRKGMLKLSRVTADGRQRILRILRPGDVVGLEALATNRYDSEAVALSVVEVCRIPTDVIHRLSQQSPRMHWRLLQKWQEALREADDWLAAINFGTARQRVANFVLKMRHSGNPDLTTLFSREDMGAMMDLKLETVSREISALVRNGALEPQDKAGRLYRIVDEECLLPTVATH